MSERSKEIDDMILESPLVDPRILDILIAMNRRMDEIEASVLKAKHDATPLSGWNP